MFNIDQHYSRNTYSYLKHFIRRDDKVLDVGSGNCLVAQKIKDELKAAIHCVDVCNHSKTSITPKIFDGRKIPYGNKTFKSSLAAFVLHHCPHQEELLQEMIRVSSQEIIILEDVPQHWYDHWFIVLHRFTSYFKYNSKKMIFRRDGEWKALFRKLGLRVKQEIEIKKDRGLVYPVNRKLYLLTVYA
ncbi:MAG: hypothetical protein A2445_00680 [Candidatus Jacksonbacteria bacterium RIFOXYC2_FULL_44_29]|nr:MAG: Methyltransferase type 11 [Parcubacteria group bacterium GW2011_GWC2_44_22]OGY76071.1 MAG: hypothetical protein A2295_03895 [Candidatus Jacksonbacteria bacterium RIFOXYB2_FULL_44_15]OGY76374.1 MAG: hypothetical protein A2240_04410 [Candidatus Jacksonbacteria bacterium RIFOXYA2_FULL_43_12]OGY78012.1 MAG: hypothetical protein A2445_00680 [Candidatus Jacksonbacteria bacterium RIFOXYC2_FULL_44_29]OGY80316.1 MAG: hypothetical protein A2550_04405 [Candidatus Jacksonbacteria bacterium RIFOXYD2